MSLAHDFHNNIQARSFQAAVTTALDPALDVMARTGVRLSYGKDEEIYGQDEPAEFVYQVVHGAVRTCRVMSDGRRQIGDFYGSGDLFGLETGTDHRYAAEALQSSLILVLKRSTLKSACGDFERLIQSTLRRDLERAQEHMLRLGRKTAMERVASFLLDLDAKSPGQPVDLPMGRQDMADYLGLTIETVSRMLSQLQSL